MLIPCNKVSFSNDIRVILYESDSYDDLKIFEGRARTPHLIPCDKASILIKVALNLSRKLQEDIIHHIVS